MPDDEKVPKTPLDDERYLTFVRKLMEASDLVVKEEGYQLNGLIILVEADHQGVTIASSLDSDDETRRILAEAIARSHKVISRRFE